MKKTVLLTQRNNNPSLLKNNIELKASLSIRSASFASKKIHLGWVNPTLPTRLANETGTVVDPNLRKLSKANAVGLLDLGALRSYGPTTTNLFFAKTKKQGGVGFNQQPGKNLISYNFNKDMKIVNSLSIATQPMASNPTRISSWLLTEGLLAPLLLSNSRLNKLATLVGPSGLGMSKPLGLGYALPTKARGIGGLTEVKRWYLIEEIQKLLISYFKSIYSLIGKAKFKFFPNKIAIEILYYITIPDANIFTWYNLINKGDRKGLSNNLNTESPLLSPGGLPTKRKNKLIKLLKKNKLKYPSLLGRVGFTQPNWSSFSVIGLGKNYPSKDLPSLPLKAKSKEATSGDNKINQESEGKGGGINFFKLNLNSINYLYSNKFKSLLFFFNKILNKPIELDLIRLHHSDSDSNILAQLFLLVLKKKNIRSVINKIYNKNKVKKINLNNWNVDSLQLTRALPLVTPTDTNEELAIVSEAKDQAVKLEQNLNLTREEKMNKLSNYIPVFISGLYIHIGGRLMREPIIPRLTTKKFEKGAIALGKVDSLEKTQVTKKNKKGAYTIKIFFAQNII